MDKEKLILEAALNLFTELGFHGTPTSRVAKEAGVSNGTLFHYFKTKEVLVREVYLYVKGDLASKVAINPDPNVEYRLRLKELFLMSLQWALDHPISFRYIQQFHNSPYAQLLSDAKKDAYVQQHLEIVKEGIDQQQLQQMAPDFVFTLISHHTYGLFQYITEHQFSQDEQKRYMEQGFNLLWKMIT